MSGKSFEEFEVIIYDPVPAVPGELCPEHSIVKLLEQTGMVGWLSPLHQPDPDESGIKKPHWHCILLSETRIPSLKKLREKLALTGLNFRGSSNVWIEHIHVTWAYALLYLTHNTHKAKVLGKEQFPVGTRPYPINQSLSGYSDQICNMDYQDTILDLIRDYEIVSCRELQDLSRRLEPQFAPLVWRDLNKWERFLYEKKTPNPQDV